MINEKRREKAGKKYHKKHLKPVDQRAKRTRAARRLLTPHEKSIKTAKLLKKLRSNPKRKYALEA